MLSFVLQCLFDPTEYFCQEMPQIIDLTDARQVSPIKDVGYVMHSGFVHDPDDVFFIVQVQAHADPCQCRNSCFLQVSSIHFLHPYRDPASSGHPSCIHVSQRSPNPVGAAGAFCLLHPTASVGYLQGHTALTLFFAFCASSAEILHSSWR